MTTPNQSVESAALALDEEERARLAQRLMSSLTRDSEFNEEWDAEVRRRVALLETGVAETVPADEVFAEARKRLGR